MGMQWGWRKGGVCVWVVLWGLFVGAINWRDNGKFMKTGGGGDC